MATLGELRKRHEAVLKAIDEQRAAGKRKREWIEQALKHLREIDENREDARARGDHERVEALNAQTAEVLAKIAATRDERHDVAERITELQRRESKVEAERERKISRKTKRLDAIDCFDGCAVPRGWKLILLDARENGWDGTLQSGDRTPANCDHCSDKSSQAELYAAFLNGTGAPANPPGTGTHEYVNDGTAYPSAPRGQRGPWWWLGLDAGLGDQLMDVLTRLGYIVRRPYMPREPWHVNCVGDPTPVLIKRGRIPKA